MRFDRRNNEDGKSILRGALAANALIATAMQPPATQRNTIVNVVVMVVKSDERLVRQWVEKRVGAVLVLPSTSRFQPSALFEQLL